MSVTWEGLNPPYATIVADPPWDYRQKGRIVSTAKRVTTKPQLQYGRMTLADVCSLSVPDLAANDAHLYLWATNPMLREAFEVVEAWGFSYITLLTWRKLGTLGMGYYFRGDTEHVLFAVRGKLPIPPANRIRNWFEAPKGRHSAKPAAFGDLVERVSPGPYVELFARAPRLGWDHWGKGYEIGEAS